MAHVMRIVSLAAFLVAGLALLWLRLAHGEMFLDLTPFR